MEKTLHLARSLSTKEREEVENYVKDLNHDEKNELLKNIIRYIRETTS